MARSPWGWWPFGQEPEEPEPTGRRFACPNCRQEILLEHVLSVQRVIAPDDEPKVRLIVAHPCRDYPRSMRFEWDDSALRRLFGGDYYVPYPRPMGMEEEGETVDPPPAPPITKDVLLERWRWELDQCSSGRDFLLFCRGPRRDLEGGV